MICHETYREAPLWEQTPYHVDQLSRLGLMTDNEFL